MKDAILALEDGTILKGKGIGKDGCSTGELVFTTSFTGYEESITDPSFKGQLLIFTYPLVGNYGCTYEHMESESIMAEGVIMREDCENPSHRNSEDDMNSFLKKNDSRGISDIDTRMLTTSIREKGTIKATLCVGDINEKKAVEMAKNLPDIRDRNLVPKVTSDEPYDLEGNGKKLAVIDTGIKRSILESLSEREYHVKIFPPNTDPEDIKKFDPEAIFVGNGPGNPAKVKGAIRSVEYFIGDIPIFGICFGLQIISLAMGAETFKLKFGHRGANQPVKDHKSGRVYITSQNHGFAVDKDSLDDTGLEVIQTNANDGTVEAVRHKNKQVFAVQYHPEANPGPKDTESMFFETLNDILGG